MPFKALGLCPELVNAVTAKGYETPSPIQARAIPAILEGSDVIGGAQTGTGKTAAFSLPLLQRLSNNPHKTKRPRALVLTPTRELAAQVHESIVDYGSKLSMRSTVIFGGVGFNPQVNKFRRGLDIVVATPGRLLDLCERGVANLGAIEILVLDEADRMLDMGFIHDIKKIIKRLPEDRQNLLFSATYSKEVKRLSDTILNQPVEIEVAPRNSTADQVHQEAYQVSKAGKRAVLADMIKKGNWSQVLIFTRTKHGANRLVTQLERTGISAMPIHGNKSQNARERALKSFKNNEIQALVATDIAARGLDIAELPYVVNYELPNVPEDYVHRIGRTGRAGKSGKAISLVCDDENEYLDGIEKLLKKEIPMFVWNEDGEPEKADRTLRSSSPRSGGNHRRPQRNRSRGGGGGRSGGGRQRSSDQKERSDGPPKKKRSNNWRRRGPSRGGSGGRSNSPQKG